MANERAVIYARLSEEDKLADTSLSIQNQIVNLKDYCFKHSFELVEIYADDGYTGGHMDRPAFKELLKDLYLHKFELLLVKDISRISRNLIEVGRFIEEICPLEKIRVISILDHYDSKTYPDDESIVFRSFMNDYYLKECKKKAYQSLKRRIVKKPLNTTPFYGYNLIHNTFVPHPQESLVVKRIFEDYAKGIGTFELARKLKEEKIYCPAYSLNQKIKANYSYVTPYDWKPNAILRILKRKAYTGTHINGIHSKHFEEVAIENAYEPIISTKLYDLVQKKLNENKKNKLPVSDYAHFFYNKKTGIVGHLERRTTRTAKTKSGVRIETIDPRLCLGDFSVSIPILKRILRKEINLLYKELTQDKLFLANLLNKDSTNLKKQIEMCEKSLLKKESQMKRNIELRFSNQIEESIYKKNVETLKEEIRILEDELKSLKQKNPQEPNQNYEKIIHEFLSCKRKNKDIIQVTKTLFKRIELEKVNGKLILEFQYNL